MRDGKQRATVPEDCGRLVKLDVRNTGDEPLSLIWVPDVGASKEYAQLTPGEQLTQQSAIGHKWQLVRSSGEVAAETMTTDVAEQYLSIEIPGNYGGVSSSSAASMSAPRTSAVVPDGGLVALNVHNADNEPLSLMWVPGEGATKEYAQLTPGERLTQQSAIGHKWQLVRSSGEVAAEMTTTNAKEQCLSGGAGAGSGAPSDAADGAADGAADSAADGAADGTADGTAASELARQVDAFYAQTLDAGVAGITIKASASVGTEALSSAALLLQRMLKGSPAQVLDRLHDSGCSVAVIGRHEKASDIPEHRATCVDATQLAAVADRTRGLGGTLAVPVTSCGEEVRQAALGSLDRVAAAAAADDDDDALCVPLLALPSLLIPDSALHSTVRRNARLRAQNLIDIGSDRHYPLESILVHEFGHTVMNIGLDEDGRAQVEACYRSALASGRVVSESYMGSCADEYWAEGVQ